MKKRARECVRAVDMRGGVVMRGCVVSGAVTRGCYEGESYERGCYERRCSQNACQRMCSSG